MFCLRDISVQVDKKTIQRVNISPISGESQSPSSLTPQLPLAKPPFLCPPFVFVRVILSNIVVGIYIYTFFFHCQ